jgi:hypothetical protein
MDMKTFLMRGAAAALLLAGTTAHAISLGFSPASQAVPGGSSVAVDLVISGLGDFAAPSLGNYNLDVVFDPAILALTGVALGDPVLGNQLDLFGVGTFATVDSSVAGTVYLEEISFDSPSDLDTLQPGSFTLARLTFDALAIGTSPLDLANVVLGDSFGLPLETDLTPGSITVVLEPSVVPEPSTVTLFLMGALALGMAWRRTAG